MKPFDDLLAGVHSATISDVAVLVREVRVRVGVLSNPVTIRIYYRPRESEPFTFEISASMKTAKGAPSPATEAGAATENEALRRAIRTLTQDYEEAVRRGEMPDDEWLVEPSSSSRE